MAKSGTVTCREEVPIADIGQPLAVRDSLGCRWAKVFATHEALGSGLMDYVIFTLLMTFTFPFIILTSKYNKGQDMVWY
jgi:hypothetical protein